MEKISPVNILYPEKGMFMGKVREKHQIGSKKE